MTIIDALVADGCDPDMATAWIDGPGGTDVRSDGGVLLVTTNYRTASWLSYRRHEALAALAGAHSCRRYRIVSRDAKS